MAEDVTDDGGLPKEQQAGHNSSQGDLSSQPEGTPQLRTKEEITCRKLRELILSAEFPAGEFISQRLLANRIGCAVVTLRAALRQLESEGLIENVPKWGVRVPVETPASLCDRYYVREVFEIEAVRQIVRNRRKIDPEPLRDVARLCDSLAEDAHASPERFGDIHFQFHRLLVASSGSPLLATSYSRVNLKSVFLWNAVHVRHRPRPHRVGDHDQLLDIIWSSDEQTACGAISHHIRRGLHDELEILDQG